MIICCLEKPAISLFCEGREPILIVFPSQEERDQWMNDLSNKNFEVSAIQITRERERERERETT
jgi:hypothetical protein